ncbi:MAG: hypothetical protein ACRDRV_13115 [Pseudonocardiaceae bacterium]
MAERDRLKENPPLASSLTSDATAARVKKWGDRFDAKRGKIAATTVVEDTSTLLSRLQEWPKYDAKNNKDEHTGARRIMEELIVLKNKLLNVLEQVERQMIVIEAATEGLGERKMLGVVADGRLEAVCIWKILTGTGETAQEEDANFWDPAWKKTLYIEELTSAPWNVGWPTKESGVSGAGTSLVNAMKDKAKAEKCDGIGLVGLGCNLGFYTKAGFKNKPGSDLAFIMDLRK